MKIDLHVHSRHSTRPSQWLLQKIGCPESFTDPRFIHRAARARGMDMVTIADHNTIAGALQIAHLADVFISVEITSYFPEDGCKVHVLAWNIDEAQFRDIQKVRENVYELAPFLRGAGICHACAHPLYGVNGKTRLEHVEKLLLLFKTLELNGCRLAEANRLVARLASALTPADMDRLAERHQIVPDYPEPWRKNLVGGSDDHGGLNIARRYTEVPGAATLKDFLLGLESGRAVPGGEDARPETMALNLSSIAYQYFKGRLGLERAVGRDVCVNFVDRFLSPEPGPDPGLMDRLRTSLGARRYRSRTTASLGGLREIVQQEAARQILDDPALLGVSRGQDGPGRNRGLAWYRFVNGTANQVLRLFADRFLDAVSGGNFLDLFHILGSAGSLYTLLAPHFVSYAIFGEDRRFVQAVERALLPGGPRPEQAPGRLAHFTDTYQELNGVARNLRDSLARSRRLGQHMDALTCGPDGSGPDATGPDGRVLRFEPIGVYALPEYPQQSVAYPPVLDMIRAVHEGGFTHLNAETPGPVGLTAILAARVLKLPLYGSYHTRIPQYVRQLTGDDGLEEMSWRYMRWFYSQMDRVYAPSRATAEELAAQGVPADTIHIAPRGVDTDLFHPSRRNGFLHRYTLPAGRTLLYVGRLSREKGLDLLAEAFVDLTGQGQDLNLLLVGDGPHAPALRERLEGHPRCRFAGVLTGEDLAACYASSDLFVFPSATDTFGNVVLEAQASGLPIIVSGQGGPQENVVHGLTGLVLEPLDAQSLTLAVRDLSGSPDRLAAMGRAARAHMEARGADAALRQAWDQFMS